MLSSSADDGGYLPAYTRATIATALPLHGYEYNMPVTTTRVVDKQDLTAGYWEGAGMTDGKRERMGRNTRHVSGILMTTSKSAYGQSNAALHAASSSIHSVSGLDYIADNTTHTDYLPNSRARLDYRNLLI